MLWPLLMAGLIISGLVQLWVYWSFGGVWGYIYAFQNTTAAFAGWGWVFMISESFPLQRLRRGGQLSGTLTIRDSSQPVTFDLLAADCDKPASDCPIVVSGSIRRSAFGMRSRRGALSDKVDLHFEVFAIPSAERLDQ